jgi:glutamate 5-kinase
LQRILGGEELGTYFAPHRARGKHRKLWIEFAVTPRGRITVDDGAVRALVTGGKSLLPVGVTGCDGEFVPGDAVEVAGPDGVVVARGITDYASDEIPAIMGSSIRNGGREIIHRDFMVIL